MDLKDALPALLINLQIWQYLTLATEDANTDCSMASDTDDEARIPEPSTTDELLRIVRLVSKKGRMCL